MRLRAVRKNSRCPPRNSLSEANRVFFVFYPIPTQLEVHGMRERALVSRVSTLRYKLISAFTFIYSDDSCLSHA